MLLLLINVFSYILQLNICLLSERSLLGNLNNYIVNYSLAKCYPVNCFYLRLQTKKSKLLFVNDLVFKTVCSLLDFLKTILFQIYQIFYILDCKIWSDFIVWQDFLHFTIF